MTFRIEGVDVCLLLEQPSDDVGAASPRGEVQRGLPLIGVPVGQRLTLADELLQRSEIAEFGSVKQVGRSAFPGFG